MAGLPESPIRLCGAAAAVNPRLPPGGLLERLLAALVLAGADGLRRDELVELLWPDQPPTDSGRALNPLLSRLRHAVGVVEGRDAVRLGSLSITVDLREALLLLARARAGEEPAAVHAAARDAAAILAGPLLSEHADPWTIVLAVDPFDLERELGDLLADLGRLVPALHRRLTVPLASSGGDPDSTRYRQFEAVSALLGVAGAEAPLLLILDDAQWLDGSTVQLVDHLLRSSQLPRLTVAVTARRAIDGTPAPVRLLRDAAGPRASTSLDLGPLGLQALGELVEVHAPSPGVDSAAEAARLLERTGGSPLFALAEIRAGPGTSGDLADTVVASLDAAGPEVRELVELLAVDGGRAELHVLARACGVEVERVARLVDIAEQAGLVYAVTAAGTMHDAVAG